MASAGTGLFSVRSEVIARWVAVMSYRRKDRGMVVAPWQTRCVRTGDIHEFVVCDPREVEAQEINNVAYLGFAEITESGVIAIGDELLSGENVLGTVCGFDETHMPNHYNVLVANNKVSSGKEIGLELNGIAAIRGRT